MGGRCSASAALFTLTSFAASGCSFLFDFPEEGALGGAAVGGADPGGGGGGGGGGDSGGGGTTPGAVVAEVVWRAIPYQPAADVEVTISSLEKVNTEVELLYAYGLTDAGIDQLAIPLTTGSQLFVAELRDDGSRGLTFYGGACDDNERRPIPRQLARATDDRTLLFTGSLPTTTNYPEAGWALTSITQVTECQTGFEQTIEADPLNANSDVPFIGNHFMQNTFGESLDQRDGVMLSGDAKGPEGAAAAVLFGAFEGTHETVPYADGHYFIRVATMRDFTELYLEALPINMNAPHRAWPGAAALDDTFRAWFTGASCAADGDCIDEQVFFGNLAAGEAQPEMLVERPGGHSAGTAVRVFDSTVLLAGHYRESLDFMAASLPAAESEDPFVIAVDVAGESLWAYPTEAGSFDAERWEAVVDVAALGTREDGAVYVLGCSVPFTATTFDCNTPEPGKSGFLAKLDAATGAEQWRSNVTVGDEQLFLPTALTAAENKVWVAATFFGEVDAWGEPLASGVSREAVVLRLEP